MAPSPKAVPILVNPYDGKTGLLIPFILERIRKMAGERASELSPDRVMLNVGARVYAGDLMMALLAFLDEKGTLVGHALATIESDGVNSWVFVSQVGMDPGDWGDVIARAIGIAEAWARAFSEEQLLPRGRKPITEMLMATTRDDKAWQRRYGFKTRRYIMGRTIGKSEEVSEE